MGTRNGYNKLTALFVNTWHKRQPYALTKKALVICGVLSAALALWNAMLGHIIEGFVLYGFMSMMLFMLRYALTHL